jgi:hypothetical protein
MQEHITVEIGMGIEEAVYLSWYFPVGSMQ